MATAVPRNNILVRRGVQLITAQIRMMFLIMSFFFLQYARTRDKPVIGRYADMLDQFQALSQPILGSPGDSEIKNNPFNSLIYLSAE